LQIQTIDYRLELWNSAADSELTSSLNPLCTDRIENTVSNNTSIIVSEFTDLLLRKGLRDPVDLLLWTLSSNGRCLQSHCLATGLYATI
jgi:hypothetical protein